MKILLFFFVIVMFIGCSTIPQGTAPSSSPLIMENGKIKHYEIVGPGEGSAGHFTLFGFIPFGRTDIDKAINNAIAPYHGDNLINVNYYVNGSYYFIGSSTSITVKGDVIKYVDKENSGITKTNTLYNPINEGPNSYHRFSLGSAVDGFSMDYSYIKPLNDFLFYSLTVGYKNYTIKETQNYYFYYYNYYFSQESDHKYSAIPITFNFGGNAKKFINIPNIPVNPYASLGIAYIPLIGTEDEFDQLGMNFNIGVNYELIKGLAVGLDYRYLKSFIALGSFNGNEGIGFSNLNLTLTYYP